MKLDELINLVLEKTNIKISNAQAAKIMGISRQSVGRYNEADLPERHVRAIENHFKFSLAPKNSLNTLPLQSPDNIMHIKVPKGTKVLIEYED